MSKLSYRTIADERPQGKPKVYFSCHADDFEQYFDGKKIDLWGHFVLYWNCGTHFLTLFTRMPAPGPGPHEWRFEP